MWNIFREIMKLSTAEKNEVEIKTRLSRVCVRGLHTRVSRFAPAYSRPPSSLLSFSLTFSTTYIFFYITRKLRLWRCCRFRCEFLNIFWWWNCGVAHTSPHRGAGKVGPGLPRFTTQEAPSSSQHFTLLFSHPSSSLLLSSDPIGD